MVRIISGIAKGRRLLIPQGNEVRPTLDRVKESIFNVLQSKIPNSLILDLYAGSGNLGFEALSRGASFACFVEKSKNCIRLIQENLKSLGFKQTAIRQFSVIQFLAKKADRKYDIIFIDPPYEVFEKKEFIPLILDRIIEGSWIQEGGMIVIEHPKQIMMPDAYKQWMLLKNKKFGQTNISFLAPLLQSEFRS